MKEGKMDEAQIKRFIIEMLSGKRSYYAKGPILIERTGNKIILSLAAAHILALSWCTRSVAEEPSSEEKSA